jgi:hypothetical protein
MCERKRANLLGGTQLFCVTIQDHRAGTTPAAALSGLNSPSKTIHHKTEASPGASPWLEHVNP